MRKIAVVFPGIGYNSDKPLLYFSKKIAKEHDFEIEEILFKDMDRDILGNREKMLAAFTAVTRQAEEQLKNINFEDFGEIIFISKSIGTVAASVYAAKHKIPARQVFFTPLEQTFSLVEEQNGLVFFGTKDPWIDIGRIQELCNEKKLHFRTITGGNHSLETGKVYDDVETISNVIQETEDYLVGGPIYQFSVIKRGGGAQSLKDFRGKVLLIVNTATGCGFTPQYEALESMYRDYRSEGFEILDFPCNQFGRQAPGSAEEIHRFCTARYDISFNQYEKIEVNGPNELELYTYLKSKQGFRGFYRNSPESFFMEKMAKETDPGYQNNSDIKWNFTKFLVNRMGQVIDRFEPDAGTEIVRQAVEREIEKEHWVSGM